MSPSENATSRQGTERVVGTTADDLAQPKRRRKPILLWHKHWQGRFEVGVLMPFGTGCAFSATARQVSPEAVMLGGSLGPTYVQPTSSCPGPPGSGEGVPA